MDKCWFVLKHTDYAPPEIEEENGCIKQKGPICLGHFLKNPRDLDEVINDQGPEPFALDMPLFRTRRSGFTWESDQTKSQDVSVTADLFSALPIVAVDAKAALSIALKKSVKVSWQIQELEAITVRPTRSYINQCIITDAISDYIKTCNLGPSWSAYLVTGLLIARGDSVNEEFHQQSRNVDKIPGLGIPGIAQVKLGAKISQDKSNSSSSQYSHDFVWALRLSKVNKGVFDTRWTVQSYTRGATYDTNEAKETVQSILEDEKMGDKDVLVVSDAEEQIDVIVF